MKPTKKKKTPASVNLQFPEESEQIYAGAGISGKYMSGTAGVMRGGQVRPAPAPAISSQSSSRPGSDLTTASTNPGNLYACLDIPTTGTCGPEVGREAPSMPARTNKLSGVKNMRDKKKSIAAPDEGTKGAASLRANSQSGKRRVKKGTDRPKNAHKLSSAKPVLPDIRKQTDRMLSGYLENLPTPRSSVVRVFLSSTFSDFKAERNFLYKKAYPRLKAFCSQHGLDFQVTDLRWGIRESATNDHTVEALCLAEIRKCQDLSAGPSIAIMLGNRYGFRPLAHEIIQEEFEMLMAIAEELSLDNRPLLKTWYRLDENSVPPKYILQDIRSLLPHYGDETPGNEGLRIEASETWNTTMKAIQKLLRVAVTEAFNRKKIDENTKRRYFISVTEREIEVGHVKAADPNTSCLTFVRSLEGLAPDPSDTTSRKYIDTKTEDGVLKVDEEATSLMADLKNSRIPSRISAENINSYSVRWERGGIQSGKETAHHKYLTEFANDFSKKMEELIQKHIKKIEDLRVKELAHVVTLPPKVSKAETEEMDSKKERKVSRSQIPFGHHLGIVEGDLHRGLMSMKALVSEHWAIEAGNPESTQMKVSLNAEILSHLKFCRNKCSVFCGRESELAQAQKYLTSENETKPFVVTAPSGSGKTAYMAQVAKRTKRWVGDHGVTIARFLGTSPQSSSLLPLLASLCCHIAAAYGEPLQHVAVQHIASAQKYFLDLLFLVSYSFGQARPLVILLDSIDQLSHQNSPFLLHWLPRNLPSHVKVIVSLVPDVNNGLENARAHLQDDRFILYLEPLALTTAEELIVAYPSKCNRRLSSEQVEYILKKAAVSDSHPLLLKLWLDEACTWRSYTPVSDLQLAATVKEAIETLFTKLERKYGHKFISASLGYITLCLDGITEVELEDVLSCNDEVLNEVYKYHDPPMPGMIRIPPLLWTRTRFDLKEYIVEHQGVDKATLSWYHRQFIEAATQRYASGQDATKRHLELAEHFIAEDQVCRTIHLHHRKLTIEDADRLVTIQKLTPKNVRKMFCMSHHLAFSGDFAKFKDSVLCNYRYMETAYSGIFAHEYIHEKTRIWRHFDDCDEEIAQVTSAFRFENTVIAKDLDKFPIQLMSQLLPLTSYYPFIASLCSQAADVIHKSNKPYLKPVTGCIRDNSSPVSWYVEGPTGIIAQSQNGNHLLLRYSGKGKNIPFCRVFDVICCQVIHTIYKNKLLANDVLYAGALSRNNSRVYLLCKKRFVVFPVNDSGAGKAQYATTDVNGAGPLNECLVVSSNDKHLVLAGPSRLVMFEDTGKSFNAPDFQMRRAMNFSGATATTNLMLSDDEAMTITSHTIPGQNRVIGALALWKFWRKDPCQKVPLPEPVPSGCLRLLPALGQGNCVIAGCVDGKVYIVNMNESLVLQQISNDVGLRGQGLILDVHRNQKVAALGCKESDTIAILEIVNGNQVGHLNAKNKLQTLQFGPDDTHLSALARNGTLKVFNLADQAEKASVVAHEKDVTSLVCSDEVFILTAASDRTLRQFELKRLLNPELHQSPMSEEDKSKDLVYAEVNTFSVTEDTEAIITGNRRGLLCCWGVETGKLRRRYSSATTESIDQVVVPSTSKRLLSLDRGTGFIHVWHLDTAEPIRPVRTIQDVKHITRIDGRPQVACLCDKGAAATIVLYDVEENKELKRVPISEKPPVPSSSWTTKNGRFLAFLLSSEDDSGDCACYDLRIFDLEKDLEQDAVTVDRPVYCIYPCGEDMFLLGVRGHAIIWQGPVGAWDMLKFNGWLGHASQVFSKKRKLMEDVAVTCVSVSANGDQMATAGEDGSIIVWRNMLLKRTTDSAGGHPLRGHDHAVLCMDFSETGRLLVAGSKDKTLRLWDALTGVALAQVYLHVHVTDVTFVSSDRRVAVRTKGVSASHMSIWEILGVDIST